MMEAEERVKELLKNENGITEVIRKLAEKIVELEKEVSELKNRVQTHLKN